MKTAVLLLISLGLLAVPPASAETIKGGYPACQTEAYFDQMIAAVVRDDTRLLKEMLESGQCFIVKAGLQASILQTRGPGAVRVRVYLKTPGADPSLELWTVTENVQ